MIDVVYQEGLGYCINTLYFNQVPMTVRHPLENRKTTLERAVNNVEEIRRRLQGKLYLGYNNAGLTAALKTVLAELFPEPSRFEGSATNQSEAHDQAHCELEEALAVCRDPSRSAFCTRPWPRCYARTMRPHGPGLRQRLRNCACLLRRFTSTHGMGPGTPVVDERLAARGLRNTCGGIVGGGETAAGKGGA